MTSIKLLNKYTCSFFVHFLLLLFHFMVRILNFILAMCITSISIRGNVSRTERAKRNLHIWHKPNTQIQKYMRAVPHSAISARPKLLYIEPNWYQSYCLTCVMIPASLCTERHRTLCSRGSVCVSSSYFGSLIFVSMWTKFIFSSVFVVVINGCKASECHPCVMDTALLRQDDRQYRIQSRRKLSVF